MGCMAQRGEACSACAKLECTTLTLRLLQLQICHPGVQSLLGMHELCAAGPLPLDTDTRKGHGLISELQGIDA